VEKPALIDVHNRIAQLYTRVRINAAAAAATGDTAVSHEVYWHCQRRRIFSRYDAVDIYTAGVRCGKVSLSLMDVADDRAW